jgi:fructose-1-phosphate kinase PfkB-like protein
LTTTVVSDTFGGVVLPFTDDSSDTGDVDVMVGFFLIGFGGSNSLLTVVGVGVGCGFAFATIVRFGLLTSATVAASLSTVSIDSFVLALVA